MNDFAQITNYLFDLQRNGIKLTLDNINLLLKPLNNPQDKWRCIHIAGTNGKGSTAAIMESILMRAGYKVGLYTSPHLVDFRERIRINRVPITEKEVIRFTQKMKPLIEEIEPSFFEVTTALGFWYFAEEKVDIALIEVGLGGRLDSTNVVTPLISVITKIDFDHQKYLGKSIREIAAEKAGIIKPNIPCITYNQNKEVLDVLSQKCLSQNSELINTNNHSRFQISSMNLEGTDFDLQIGNNNFNNLHLNLPGDHQIDNAVLALGTLLFLKNHFEILDNYIFEGIKDVQWKGRINLVKREPFLIIDVSHNTSGFEKTLSFLGRYFPKEKFHAITFLQEDKDFQKIGELLSYYTSDIHIADLKLGKPLNPLKLLKVLKQRRVPAKIIYSFADVQKKIFDRRWKDHLWLIIGSHYLAGEAYQKIQTS